MIDTSMFRRRYDERTIITVRVGAGGATRAVHARRVRDGFSNVTPSYRGRPHGLFAESGDPGDVVGMIVRGVYWVVKKGPLYLAAWRIEDRPVAEEKDADWMSGQRTAWKFDYWVEAHERARRYGGRVARIIMRSAPVVS